MIDQETPDVDDPTPYEPTDAEIARGKALNDEERAAVAELVLRECSDRWQKVAKIMGDLLHELGEKYPQIPLSYLQETMVDLEERGRVEILGDVWAARYSEIRLV